MDWVFREAHESDLPELVELQERGAVEGLGHIFPQETHPFPRADILDRWAVELADPSIAFPPHPTLTEYTLNVR